MLLSFSANADGTSKFSQDDILELDGGLNTSRCLMFDPSSNTFNASSCLDGKGICKKDLGMFKSLNLFNHNE